MDSQWKNVRIAFMSSISLPVAFITGASSGIGAAAVRSFADAGFNVVLAARRVDKLEALARELQSVATAKNARLICVACDVCSDESVKAAFEVVRQEFGQLNVL